jgi:catechol 2,3-dioxygenase-like lactoylglutathione lyase family enzyme
MQLEDAYPIIVTDQLAACREFYTRWLGFQIAFEASWFVYLASGGGLASGGASSGGASAGERPRGIAFMAADHPSQPPGPETFGGTGMFLTLQVADAAAEFERLRAAGVPIAYALRDEAWGQRRFGLRDPAGVWVDIVQHIEPAPGYWDRYLPSSPPG